MGHFGFSYMGLIFLLMLAVPNILWAKSLPKGYSQGEEKPALVALERVGQAAVTASALLFSDYNLKPWSAWSLWLIFAVFAMLLYEMWWLRYFKSDRTEASMYRPFFGIPVAGAALPVTGFFLLGVYGKVVWLMISAVIFGVGHIGIHWGHKKNLKIK